jgi:two-component system, LytTR family, response regulator LytT
MIRCFIVDDELIARQILEQYILQTPGLTLLGTCRNAMEAFAKLEQHEVDLIFLDIEMPLVSGLDFIKKLARPPKIILTTAYPQHAVEAFALNAVDYLLKPFSLERFQQAVAKVKLETLATDEALHLMIREKNSLLKLPQQEIIYLKASKDYVKIITTQKSHLVSSTMKALEETLPANQFVRIHKSFIVNVRHIQMIKAAEVIMADKEVLPLSPNFKDRLLEIYSK